MKNNSSKKTQHISHYSKCSTYINYAANTVITPFTAEDTEAWKG